MIIRNLQAFDCSIKALHISNLLNYVGGSSSSTLKYVWKPILNYNYCDTQTGNAGQIDTTMLCAGNAGKDACQVSNLGDGNMFIEFTAKSYEHVYANKLRLNSEMS